MPSIRFVECSEPGFSRRKQGKTWRYFYPDGRAVKASATIKRLNAIALPPAYSDAWFALDPKSHILATGMDDRGRKQYRYHPEYRESREDEKYRQALAFGAALPCIRAAVERDLARRDLSLDRVVAAIVRLLDLGSVRIGNRQYAEVNRSFGATTFRNRHANVRGEKVQLEFVGKSGKRQKLSIEDQKLARTVRRCLETPGQLLFQYRNATGDLAPVTSTDVNQYLRRHGGEFTAKNFRTWAGSRIAFTTWVQAGGGVTIKGVMEEVAARLGNTPAIARKSYVHPAIVEAISDRRPSPSKLPRGTRYLSREERGMLMFLEAESQAG
jgi:DNA topoisomerase I